MIIRSISDAKENLQTVVAGALTNKAISPEIQKAIDDLKQRPKSLPHY